MTLTLEDYKQRDILNTTIQAEIIADSVWPIIGHNKRLTTFKLVVPHSVLGHLVRHRAFSLSVASNRALRSSSVMDTLNYIPDWRTAQKGMQPAEFINDKNKRDYLDDIVYTLKNYTSEYVNEMVNKHNVAKELTNRYLAPFQLVTVLVTSSEYSNFFNLRDHQDAQYDTQIVARKMKKLLEENTPTYLERGEWHLPFISYGEAKDNTIIEQIAASVARCARTSYKLPNSENRSDIISDIRLFNKLITPPIHASPLEHVATPLRMSDIYASILPEDKTLNSAFYGNTYGWVQLRKLFEFDDLPITLHFLYPIILGLKVLLENE